MSGAVSRSAQEGATFSGRTQGTHTHDCPTLWSRSRSPSLHRAFRAERHSQQQAAAVLCWHRCRRGSSRRARRLKTQASQQEGPGPPEPQQPQAGDEPELVVLLVACGIGVGTGAGVVLFNDVIHGIRHLAWQGVPLEATHWSRWARSLPLSQSWHTLLWPPVLGGLLVGALRAASGGLGETITLDPLLRQSVKAAAAGSHSQLRPWDHLWAFVLRKPAPAGLPSPGQLASDAERAAAQVSVPSRGQHALRRLRASLRPAFRALAAAITLGTGASLGPEGPSVDIGKSVANGLSTSLRSQRRRLTPLLAAGAGAGVAAGFNAPISGVFFAVETVLQKRSRTATENSDGVTVAAVLLACVAASAVSQAGLGNNPAFRVPHYQLQSVAELPLILMLGALGGAVSAVFISSSQASDRAFGSLRAQGVPDLVLPALGGLATGLIALLDPEVLYQGWGNVNGVLDAAKGEFSPLGLAQIVALKVLATSLCRGSGLVGGLYAPSIFVGAALGLGFGEVAASVSSSVGLDAVYPQAYALVGVAAMLAGTCQVPLTAVMLLFELTHDYFIIPPTLGAVGLAYWVASLPDTTQLLARLLPGGPAAADEQAAAPPIPWQSVADAQSMSRQLGMQVSERQGREEPGNDGASAPSGPSSPDMLSSGSPSSSTSNGISAANPSQIPRRQIPSDGSRTDASAGHGASTAPQGHNGTQAQNGAVRQVGTGDGSKPQSKGGLTVQCALEGACVLLERDTLLSEALQLLDEAEQSVALIVDDDGSAVGLLTRESILAAMLAAERSQAPPQKAEQAANLSVASVDNA